MVRGRNIQAEIDVPRTVYIPRRGKHVEVPLRISLNNSGEETFVAHAANADDRHFWHVLDEHHREVLRETGRGKGGVTGVKVRGGVHSYRTRVIPGGQGLHRDRTLKVDASKLEEGHTYTVRGEFYGHLAEATFVAVREPEAPPKKKSGKATARKRGTTSQAAATRRAASAKRATRKRPAAKAKKKAARAKKAKKSK